MDQVLLELLDRLEAVGSSHKELYDSDVRQKLGNAVMDGFVRARQDYRLPSQFGLMDESANRSVREALARFIVDAKREANSMSLVTFHERLAAIQNRSVRSTRGRNDYEEFFGHSPPEFFDSDGTVVRTR